MDETEQLLSALADREQRLRKAQSDMRRAEILTRTMDLILGAEDPVSGFDAAMTLCRAATGSETWVLVGTTGAGAPVILAAGDAGLQGAAWPDASPLLLRPLHVNDLGETGWARALPAPLQGSLSLLSVPVAVPFQPPLGVALMSGHRAAYAPEDLDLLRRIGRLLGHALAHRVLVRRNAALSLVVGSDPETVAAGSRHVDSTFDALHRAYTRVADWQGRIVAITNDLLAAPTHDIDAAITRTLARTGALAGVDRTYVFRLRDGTRMDNTHEWVGEGIAPMIGELQDMPTDLLEDWRDAMLAGEAIRIEDVGALPDTVPARAVLQMQGIRSLLVVPMLRNGEITGFLGYDSVRAPRHYMPLEIQLLQSVGNAIGAVLERAGAEHRAELARQGLLATLQAVPDVVLELDSEGRFIGRYAGPGQPVVYPDEVVIGRRPTDFLPPDVAALAERIMRQVDREGHCDAQEFQMDIDGRTHTFVVSAAAKMMQGKPVGYVLATRDITARVAQRRQLQRLGKIAELTSNMVIITDARQRIEWVNPAFEHRTGWTLDEVRGKRPDSLLAFERTSSHELARIGKLLRANRPVRAEVLNRTRSGEQYWVSKDIQPLFDASGKVEGFVAVQTDITALKQSHLRALRDRAMAMDASSDGIAITDADGHYRYMNPAHRTMFGIGLHEEVGQIHWHDLYSPEVVKRFLADHWPKLEEHGTWRGELFGRHRNGRIVPQEVSLTRREDGLLCITRDISHRLHLESERARLREELQIAQSRETVAHLAEGVAHDLNNLVAIVAGSATLLGNLCNGNGEARAGVDRILRASEAARDLVTGLGHLGRPQRSRGLTDLNRIVTEAIELLGTRRNRDHDIGLALPADPCPVWANVTELLQVVVNLALNACQSGDDARNTVRLEVRPAGSALPQSPPEVGSLTPGQPYAVLRISDTGTGIDPAIRRRLFDRYFSTRGAQGTGLGLPIVAGILRNNDAALWIDSETGKGTTVTVAWPARAPESEPRRPAPATPLEPLALAGHRVLVVDDLADVADVLSEMLERVGAISVAVSDPHEAADLLRDNPGLWSAVVTDLDMPGLNGKDIARAAAACSPPVPAVLVTALPDAVSPDAALFHAVLAKPVLADDLIAAVGRTLAAPRPRAKASKRPRSKAPVRNNGSDPVS